MWATFDLAHYLTGVESFLRKKAGVPGAAFYSESERRVIYNGNRPYIYTALMLFTSCVV